MPPEIPPVLTNPAEESDSDKLMRLIREHGKIDLVPEDQLAQVGYHRVASGIQRIGVKGFADNREKEKKENIPFGEIRVALPLKKSTGRWIGEDSMQVIKKKMEFFEEIDLRDSSIFDEFAPEGHPLRRFRNEIARNITEEIPGISAKEVEYFMDDIFYWWSADLVYTRLGRVFGEEGVNLRDYIEERDGGEYGVSEEDSSRIIEDIERVIATQGDVTEIEKDFAANISINFPSQKSQYDGDAEFCPEIVSFAIKNKLESRIAILGYFVHQILGKKGVIGGDVPVFGSMQDIGKCLERLTRDADPLLEEEKTLRARMKNADVEGKKSLSSALKSIKEQRDERARLLEGIRTYCSFPELGSQFIKGKLRDFQSLFIRKSEGGSEEFILDGTPNELYDTDPGVISGDCTAGKPLPFRAPGVLAYNIKVFAENRDKKHIGNIYLLCTETKEEWKDEKGKPRERKKIRKVWHLDAIQIPSSIDWKLGFGVLIEKLGLEAAGKSIDIITVNEENWRDYEEGYENPLISNYDYIQKAVESYCRRRSAEQVTVNIPRIPENSGFSNFQGNGLGMVVWEKS